MLELHRASAGSGKTYTLAKKYIWYLITIKPEEGTRRLRTEPELADSARHILAVTFTNKATNEMQQRIVKRLFDLAYLPVRRFRREDGSEYTKSPDYLDDLIAELGVSHEEISRTCTKALKILLENYSDFKVSTIDSFFQLVLRTLAYESDLNDSFQVELDSEYLSQIGVDGTLEEIDSNKEDTETPYWIRILMDRANKGWKIFDKEFEKSLETTPYDKFVKSVKHLENEEYKLIRKELEEYFAENKNLIFLYEALQEKYETPVREAFAEFKAECRKVVEKMPDELRRDSNPRTDAGKYSLAHRNLANADDELFSDEKVLKNPAFMHPDYLSKNRMRELLNHYDPATRDALAAAMAKCHGKMVDWQKTLTETGFLHWKLYSTNLPYLALFNIVNRKRQEYLEETNSFEHSETTSILREMIAESDAPFIYERLGTTLNHFLIDEFQDTSRMQWENFRPLLIESMSRDNDNLIIGDAKQSIYRFRNADPSLITDTVPRQFRDRLETHGEKPSENTNYRSALHIVQFNNSFFEYTAKRLDQVSKQLGEGRLDFPSLYSNVVQTPHKQEREGYVEVSVFPSSINDYNAFIPAKAAALVRELIERGYRQRDIALLVYTGKEAETLIKALIANNSLREEGEEEIRFVSEQSLKVINSHAVKTIVGVLENISSGTNPRMVAEEDRAKKGLGFWKDMETAFKLYALQHPGKSMSELMEGFMEESPNMDAVTDMLRELQALAVPAIVEAVIARFLSPETRQAEAVYLAAFQDLVLEYCERHPTDIGSFLEWWERKSKSASISSPESADAVRVMTIHKSKGLEFDCVIVPYANWEMADKTNDRKQEWRWVRPQVIEAFDEDGNRMELPPFIPVGTMAGLENTCHAHLLTDYFDKVKMDYLNQAYVAFTRAGKELYIFTKNSKKKEDTKKKKEEAEAVHPSIGKCLEDFLEGNGGEPDPEDIARLHANDRVEGRAIEEILPACPDFEASYTLYSIGEKVMDVMAAKRAKEERAKKEKLISITSALPETTDHEVFALTDYASTIPGADKMKFHESGAAGAMLEEEDEESEEDLDPRSEGNIKHAILELVERTSDLPKAVRHLVVNGVISPSMGDEMLDDLKEKLSSPEVSGWFDGTARVINERPLLKGGHVSRRPDRILAYPDGHAEVIDYKFGTHHKHGAYRGQVQGYARRLLETGRFTRVEGYLWYVNEGVIEPTATFS